MPRSTSVSRRAPFPDRLDAAAALASRYFATRGPATLKDFTWWSGLPAADARRALAAIGSSHGRSADGQQLHWRDDDVAPLGARPRADFVQCYDEAIISYTESRGILATGGVAFPTPRHLDGFVHVVLLDGRLLGHWRRGRSGSVDIRPARRLAAAEREAVEEARERYVRFTGH
jgi:hypothetical protein